LSAYGGKKGVRPSQEDLSGNLLVQLGAATEELNRSWYERNTGRRVTDIQRRVKHSAIPWMAATLDGIVEGTEAVDPLYLSVLVSAEKKFWRYVQSGEVPHLVLAEPPRPRIEAIRIVDMSASNSWAEFAALFRNTRSAFLDHERAKSELKALMPEDAREAIGHGVRAKRSKSGAVSFDVLEMEEASHAPVQ
jgi:YqaJ-like viral recombinase domain